MALQHTQTQMQIAEFVPCQSLLTHVCEGLWYGVHTICVPMDVSHLASFIVCLLKWRWCDVNS